MDDLGGWDFGTAGFDLFGGDNPVSTLDVPDFSGSLGSLDLGGGGMDFGGIASGLDMPSADGGALGGGFGGSGGLDQTIQPGQQLVDPNNSGGGGFMDTLGGIAKSVLPAAQLGVAGMGMYNAYQAGQQGQDMSRLARQAAGRQNENATMQQGVSNAAVGQAQNLSAWSQDDLARAQRGEIPPAIQAQIEEWKRGARQHAQSQAAGSGMGNSTQLAQWMQWIEQQGQAMAAKTLMDMRQQAIGAHGVAFQGQNVGSNALSGAGQSLNSAGTMATQQANDLTNMIAAANNVLARLNAAGGR